MNATSEKHKADRAKMAEGFTLALEKKEEVKFV